MSTTFTFAWDPDRDGEEIRPSGQTAERLRAWCETLVRSEHEKQKAEPAEWASAAVNLYDFCDDMEFYIEGLRRKVVTGYTPELRDAMDLAEMQVLAEFDALTPKGRERMAKLASRRAESAGYAEPWKREQIAAIEAARLRVRREAVSGAFESVSE